MEYIRASFFVFDRNSFFSIRMINKNRFFCCFFSFLEQWRKLLLLLFLFILLLLLLFFLKISFIFFLRGYCLTKTFRHNFTLTQLITFCIKSLVSWRATLCVLQILILIPFCRRSCHLAVRTSNMILPFDFLLFFHWSCKIFAVWFLLYC